MHVEVTKMTGKQHVMLQKLLKPVSTPETNTQTHSCTHACWSDKDDRQATRKATKTTQACIHTRDKHTNTLMHTCMLKWQRWQTSNTKLQKLLKPVSTPETNTHTHAHMHAGVTKMTGKQHIKLQKLLKPVSTPETNTHTLMHTCMLKWQRWQANNT